MSLAAHRRREPVQAVLAHHLPDVTRPSSSPRDRAIGAFQIFESAVHDDWGGRTYATYFFGLNIYFTAFQSLRSPQCVAPGLDVVAIIVGADGDRFSTSRLGFYAGARDEEA